MRLIGRHEVVARQKLHLEGIASGLDVPKGEMAFIRLGSSLVALDVGHLHAQRSIALEFSVANSMGRQARPCLGPSARNYVCLRNVSPLGRNGHVAVGNIHAKGLAAVIK